MHSSRSARFTQLVPSDCMILIAGRAGKPAPSHSTFKVFRQRRRRAGNPASAAADFHNCFTLNEPDDGVWDSQFRQTDAVHSDGKAASSAGSDPEKSAAYVGP
jgi:hypothetical protein